MSGSKNNLTWKIPTTGNRCKKTGTLLPNHWHETRKEKESNFPSDVDWSYIENKYKISVDLRPVKEQRAFIFAAEMDLKVLNLRMKCYSQVWKRWIVEASRE